MNEGNANVQQVTNHACTHDYHDHPDWQCHKWGDPIVKTTPQEFAPGLDSLIDGNKLFTFSQEFRLLDGDQLQIVTTITQGAHKVVKTMGPNSQLQAMYKHGSLQDGMVFVTGYWTAPDMNWLDSDECGDFIEHCSRRPAYISNWRIAKNSGPAPGPSPGPEPSPSPSPAGDKHDACCFGGCNKNCKQPDSWCMQSKEHCTGLCNGEWIKCRYACCYGDGTCKAQGSYCDSEDHCLNKCGGEWISAS